MNNENTKNSVLSAELKKQLSYSLAELFFGLVRSNWTRGNQMLGTARQKALEQIDSFLTSKDQHNPAVAYLRDIAAARRQKCGQVIMQSPRSEQTFNLPKNQEQNMVSSGSKWVNNALQKLNQTIQEFGKSVPDKSVILTNTKQNISAQPIHKNILRAQSFSHEQIVAIIQKRFMELARERSKS